MLFRILGHWLLESSLVWLHLFLQNNWGQLWNTAGAGGLTLCGGSLGCFRSITFSFPGGLWKGSRHVVRGLNSAGSEKAVGEGWRWVQNLREELARNLGIWLMWALVGKSLHLPLWFTSPSHHLLPSVQSDLCYITPSVRLSSCCQPTTRPDEFRVLFLALGWLGWFTRKPQGRRRMHSVGSVSVCEEGWGDFLRWGSRGRPPWWRLPQTLPLVSSVPWINPKENGFSSSILEYQRRLN